MTEPNIEKIYQHRMEERLKDNEAKAKKYIEQIKQLEGVIDSKIDLISGELTIELKNGFIFSGVLPPTDFDLPSERYVRVEFKKE